MKSPRRRFISFILAGLLFVVTVSVEAQFTVWDPTNYAQAVARYEQLRRLYDLTVQQARRLPADLRRYATAEVPWLPHDLGADQIVRYLEALNAGDPGGHRYRGSVEPLEALARALARVPEPLRARLSTAYGTIQLADSVASRAVHGTGVRRAQSPAVLNALRAFEIDTMSGQADYHTQAALLGKLTGATLLELRLQERSSQLAAHALEQLLVENKRKRETEAALMNARLHQWRFGADYGRGITQHTAERLDRWRQP